MRRIARCLFLGWLLALTLGVVASLGSVAQAAPSSAIADNFANVRAGPSTDAAIVGQLAPGESFDVVGTVVGEEVVPGNATWYRTARGNFVYSGFASAGGRSAVARGGGAGRWIEVDRGALVARAIENGRVVYTAPVTVGIRGWETPVGTFTILRRVANETMDSSTVGIPLSSPQGYYLENVLYTQYFTNYGAALHYNWWRPESIGNFPASRGCVGLGLADARFFWNFADIGTRVIIH